MSSYDERILKNVIKFLIFKLYFFSLLILFTIFIWKIV